MDELFATPGPDHSPAAYWFWHRLPTPTEIKDQIAQTTQQLQNATTDAEVQKLHGVLTSLNGDLASTDDEVNQAAASAMVQGIQNRNDQQKQIQALTEQQNAEFTEAVSNYTAKFQLLNAPTVFPTP